MDRAMSTALSSTSRHSFMVRALSWDPLRAWMVALHRLPDHAPPTQCTHAPCFSDFHAGGRWPKVLSVVRISLYSAMLPHSSDFAADRPPQFKAAVHCGVHFHSSFC